MISGLQKMTLLDFPGRVACTVFLQGCNFRCPFCHNSDLLPRQGEEFMSVEAFLEFLKKRKGLLDGVCITGGEPTLQPGLFDLAKEIKALGFALKLDTNGSRPEMLKRLVEANLLDYVAMDVKHSPAGYAEITGLLKIDLAPLEESLRFLISGAVDFELRTTVVKEFHDEESILAIGRWLSSLSPHKKPRRMFLQHFVDRDSVLFAGLSAPEEAKMETFRGLLAPFVEEIALRGE